MEVIKVVLLFDFLFSILLAFLGIYAFYVLNSINKNLNKFLIYIMMSIANVFFVGYIFFDMVKL